MQPCDAIGGNRVTRAGVSPRQARVYSRSGCHLCDDAVRLLLKQGYEVETIDIDADADLREQFDECVPVVEIGGKIRFRGRVNQVLLGRIAHREM